MKEIINTQKAPKAIGPYSQAVKADGFLFVSGQIPLDPDCMQIMTDSIEGQTEQVFQNINNILHAAGMCFDDLVKVTVLLKDIADFKQVNDLYTNYFKSDYPARAAYQVSALPLGARIEIECIAYKKKA